MRGPTLDQTVSTISSALSTGNRTGVLTYRAPKSPQMCSQARSSAPYSRFARQHLVAGLRGRRPRRDVDPAAGVRDEHEVVRIGAHVGPKSGPGLGKQAVHPPGQEEHGLALQLELPFLVALEHLARHGPERPVIQKRHTWVEEKGLAKPGAVRHRSYGSRACQRASGLSVRARTGRRATSRRSSASARSRQACSSGAATATPTRRGPSWPASSPCTIRSCSGTWRGRGADPGGDRRGQRICVHGDYDVDGICATALAVGSSRARRRRRLAPAEPLRRGLRRRGATLERLAEEGDGLVLTVDCGITAVDEVAARARARARRDRHRPPPARRRAARLSDRRDAPVRLSVPRPVRHRRRLQARPGAARSPTPRCSRRHLDLVALATIVRRTSAPNCWPSTPTMRSPPRSRPIGARASSHSASAGRSTRRSRPRRASSSTAPRLGRSSPPRRIGMAPPSCTRELATGRTSSARIRCRRPAAARRTSSPSTASIRRSARRSRPRRR